MPKRQFTWIVVGKLVLHLQSTLVTNLLYTSYPLKTKSTSCFECKSNSIRSNHFLQIRLGLGDANKAVEVL